MYIQLFLVVIGFFGLFIMERYYEAEASKWKSKYDKLEKRLKESADFMTSNMKDNSFSYDLTNNRKCDNITVFCTKDIQDNRLYLKMDYKIANIILIGFDECEDNKDFCISVDCNIGFTVSKREKDMRFILETPNKSHVIKYEQLDMFIDSIEDFIEEGE